MSKQSCFASLCYAVLTQKPYNFHLATGMHQQELFLNQNPQLCISQHTEMILKQTDIALPHEVEPVYGI